jgi:ATP-dependent DNA helicase RecG
VSNEFVNTMVTADAIKLLAGAGEGYNAEFKVVVPTKVKDLSEAVCAFANAAGGTRYFYCYAFPI